MKKVRVIAMLLFIAITAVFVLFRREQQLLEDNLAPVILCPEEELQVRVSDGDDVLLQDVSAMDNRKDISNEVLVESISRFKKDGTRVVTYAVCDAAGNVASTTRTIRYTDYEKAKFSLTQPLRFYRSQDISILDYVDAWDCLDGDVSDQIKIVGGEEGWDYADTGHYEVELQVSNSAGDVSSISLGLTYLDYSRQEMSQLIFPALSEYLVNVPVNGAFDPAAYLIGVEFDSINYGFGEVFNTDTIIGRERIGIVSNVDTTKEGVYEVVYNFVYHNGNVTTTSLYVVVR